MSSFFVPFPLILPFFSALLLLIWTKPSFFRQIFIISSLLLLLLLEVFFLFSLEELTLFVSFVGGWPAPYGIALVLDLLASLFLFFTTLVFFSSVLFSFFEKKKEDVPVLRYPLLFFMLLGVNLCFLTADFFNLFVSFEIMLISSYALMTLEAESHEVKHAFLYVLMNLVGTLLFLTTAGVTYGYFGTLNFAELSFLAENKDHLFFTRLISLLFLCVFGLKTALFPFFFWLPRSYPILPPPLLAIYGGVLTKVGSYAFIRLFGNVFASIDLGFPLEILLVLSLFTMLFGVFGAISQGSIRKILSYHIISQMGFMTLAVSFFSVQAITASIVYTLHNVVVKSSLFLIGGISKNIYGTDELKKMGHLLGILPFVSLFFVFQAFSLSGIPPLSGFWAKYLIILEALEQKYYFIAFVIVLTGLLTLFSMLKIWGYAFWGEEKETKTTSIFHWKGALFSVSILSIFSLYLGFFPEKFLLFSKKASLQIHNKPLYVSFVLNNSPYLKKDEYRIGEMMKYRLYGQENTYSHCRGVTGETSCNLNKEKKS